MPKRQRDHDRTLRSPFSFEYAMKALLATPPPPAGYKATRKGKAKQSSAKKR